MVWVCTWAFAPFPSWVAPPPPAAAVCPGRVIPALGATGIVPYTPLSLNFSLHIRGLGHATLEPPDLHADGVHSTMVEGGDSSEGEVLLNTKGSFNKFQRGGKAERGDPRRGREAEACLACLACMASTQ